MIELKDILEPHRPGTRTPTHRCPMPAWKARGYSEPRETLVVGDNPYLRREEDGKVYCTWCGDIATEELTMFLDAGRHEYYWRNLGDGIQPFLQK